MEAGNEHLDSRWRHYGVMKTSLLAAAAVAGGLILPATPPLVFPKPAIIKPENLDFSRHLLLGMPLTMGMLSSSKVAKKVLTISYAGGETSTADLSSYSFTGAKIGTPAPDRYIAVVVCGASTASRTVNSVTVGGKATTRQHQPSSASNMYPSGLFITNATVESGTSATINVSMSGACTGCVAAVYVIYGSSAISVLARASSSSNHTVNAEAGGIVIAAVQTDNSISGSTNFSGMTRSFNNVVEGGGYASVGTAMVSVSGLFSVTMTTSSVNDRNSQHTTSLIAA